MGERVYASLRERLEVAGLADGALDVRLLWPSVREWLLQPASAESSAEKLVVLYVALCPPDPDDFGGRFMKAPEELRGRETVGLWLSGPGASVYWWFARDARWRAAERTGGDWIQARPTTPSIDWSCYVDRAEWLVEVEQSVEFEAARASSALAFELRAEGDWPEQWLAQ